MEQSRRTEPLSQECSHGWKACELGLFWQVERRIAREKMDGAELELMPDRRHDGPVLGARDVVKAHGVPNDDVGVFDGAIGFGPGRQAVASFALHGVVTKQVTR